MTSDEARDAETWPALIVGMGACIVLAIAGAVLDSMHLVNMSFAGIEGFWAAVIGAFLRSALVALAVLAAVWVGFVRRTGRRLMDSYFLILLATTLMAAALAGPVVAVLSAMPLVVDPYTRGVRVGAQQQQMMARDARTFEANLAAVYGPGLLDPASLAGDKDLKQIKSKLTQAHALVAAMRNTPDTREREARAQLVAATPEDRRKVIKGYEAEMSAQSSDIATYYPLNERLLGEMDGLVADLERSRGAWRVKGGHVSFNRPADLRAFNNHLRALQQLTSDLEIVRSDVFGTPPIPVRMHPDGNRP